jgi:hypothetical protein
VVPGSRRSRLFRFPYLYRRCQFNYEDGRIVGVNPNTKTAVTLYIEDFRQVVGVRPLWW